MNFCSHCGKAALHLQVPEGDNRMRWQCQNCQTIHYQNPRIVVGCLAFSGPRVLLCKRAIEPAFGKWNLPAGYLENGETVEEGALRELWEEANAKIEVERLHCIFDIVHSQHVYLHFLGRLSPETYSCGPESLEAGLFLESEIPWNEIAFSSTTFALRKYFESLKTGYSGCYSGSHT